MTNVTVPPLARPQGAKMWMRVYTVTRGGIVSPPSATVGVSYDDEPMLELHNTQLPPCGCSPQCPIRAGR
jgi:hypothetical protein